MREQAAVGLYLDNKFADVGAIASYSGLAKKLDKDGLRLLHKSIRRVDQVGDDEMKWVG